MLVVSLVGPSAAGKTSFIRSTSMNFRTITESYADLDLHRLDNRLTLSKWNFMANWFNQVISLSRSGCQLVVTDRSPLCAAAYVEEGADEYRRLAKTSIKELRAMGVRVYQILVTASLDTLLRRTAARLPHESWRGRFKEDDEIRARRVLEYYESRLGDWDARLDTTELSLPDLILNIETIINRQRTEVLSVRRSGE